ncbi:hypothetical protein TNCT_443321 [Trichonephila clavata]|uniref:Uncharacterized protein n=1 Tax=Trichonephila clavata TaxID=2740835 RepID=A0A8X6LL54_TRICU|nr:hypothetical protein TNCT_443321 [Trichonephila clavata]
MKKYNYYRSFSIFQSPFGKTRMETCSCTIRGNRSVFRQIDYDSKGTKQEFELSQRYQIFRYQQTRRQGTTLKRNFKTARSKLGGKESRDFLSPFNIIFFIEHHSLVRFTFTGKINDGR